MRFFIALVIMLGITLSSPALYAATEDAKNEKIQNLNQEAKTAFVSYSFRQGMDKLRAALAYAVSSDLVENKACADTYILLGLGVIAADDDYYRGLHYFTRALRIDKDVKQPKDLVTPQSLRVFRVAKKTLKVVDAPPTIKLSLYEEKVQRALDTVKKDARGLVHVPVDTVKEGIPIPVKAVVGVDVRATKFFLYYRAAKKVKYSRVEMKLSDGAYRNKIPAKLTKAGPYIHYYIEAYDQRGRPVANKGSAKSPNVITISK